MTTHMKIILKLTIEDQVKEIEKQIKRQKIAGGGKRQMIKERTTRKERMTRPTFKSEKTDKAKYEDKMIT